MASTTTNNIPQATAGVDFSQSSEGQQQDKNQTSTINNDINVDNTSQNHVTTSTSTTTQELQQTATSGSGSSSVTIHDPQEARPKFHVGDINLNTEAAPQSQVADKDVSSAATTTQISNQPQNHLLNSDIPIALQNNNNSRTVPPAPTAISHQQQQQQIPLMSGITPGSNIPYFPYVMTQPPQSFSASAMVSPTTAPMTSISSTTLQPPHTFASPAGYSNVVAPPGGYYYQVPLQQQQPLPPVTSVPPVAGASAPSQPSSSSDNKNVVPVAPSGGYYYQVPLQQQQQPLPPVTSFPPVAGESPSQASSSSDKNKIAPQSQPQPPVLQYIPFYPQQQGNYYYPTTSSQPPTYYYPSNPLSSMYPFQQQASAIPSLPNPSGAFQFIPTYPGTQLPPLVPPPPPQALIAKPNDNDVLCGRGGTVNSHKGNVAFRKLVSLYKGKYIKASKQDKGDVAEEIINILRNLDPPGRFLKKIPDTSYWVDIGKHKSIEKTCQTLREGAPELREKLLSQEAIIKDKAKEVIIRDKEKEEAIIQDKSEKGSEGSK